MKRKSIQPYKGERRAPGVCGTVMSAWLFGVSCIGMAGLGIGCGPAMASLPSSTAPLLSATPDGTVRRAEAMAAADRWQASADQLHLLSTPPSGWLPPSDEQRALFLEGVSLYGEGNAACVEVFDRYIRLYPLTPDIIEAKLLKGDYYFFDHHYAQALGAYNDVDLSTLGGSHLYLYTYRKMLSMLKCGFDSEAHALLDVLAARGGEYAIPSLYYKAYLDYKNGDYDAAYDGFATVADAMAQGVDETPSRPSRRGVRSQRTRKTYVSDGLEPLYYMVQIEYTRGQYRDVIDHGQTLLDRRRVPELTPELWRVMGLSRFKLGEYAPARGLLEAYVDSDLTTPAADAVYALGAIEYSAGEYKEAAAHFSTLTDLHNDIAQGAYLYLGQCAAKSGDENAAAMAFEKASRMSYDRAVSETALYNYIAAQTRGGKIPFSSSISLYEQFLDDYPSSQYSATVRESLASAYFNERDYAKALESIDKISSPSPSVRQARQKILYELGMQQLAAGDSDEAAVSLREAVNQRGGDPNIASQASLWLGDALYDLGEYEGADKAYSAALTGGVKGENAALASYNRAYSLYMQDKFAAAAPLFKSVIENKNLSVSMRSDARMRLADCLFYTNDFSEAAKIYSQIAASGGGDADYAAWRLAVVRGLQGDTSGKLQALKNFRKDHSDSRWNGRVLLELGQSQVQLGNTRQAIEAFEDLVRSYPASPEARLGSLALAGAYMESGQTSQGENAYKRILATWPTSEEADLAHAALKRHYASKGKIDEYAAYLASVPGGRSIEPDEMDTLTFEAAEAAYLDDESDVSLLRDYIVKYPAGQHVAEAMLDLKRADYDAGNYKEVLDGIDYLINNYGSSPQGVEALIMKAEILEEHYPGRRDEALEAWRMLEKSGGADLIPMAWSGIMRTTTDEKERVAYARKLRDMGGLTAAQTEEARLYEALGTLKSGAGAELADAEEALATMARNPASKSGARAAVELGQHYLATRRVKKAIELLGDFTDTGSPHQYWLAKGFITLADAYKANGQKYLAVEYLKSLKENYPGDEPEIRDAIATRLNKW